MAETRTPSEVRPVQVSLGRAALDGDLTIPAEPRGLVLFAHGSGSSRFSRRNRYVAETLGERDFATLLIDLLTPEEEAVDQRTAHLRFDVEMLAERLITIGDWVRREPTVGRLKIGLFGASTGGGAALIAAAARPDLVAAVVSRGGRPDLAGSLLRRVKAPTLLIVGERDEQVIQLNQQAMDGMTAETQMVIVPRATHLFEEPGALERVAALAGDWFERYLNLTSA
jgi:dipeptidyl aminopeptidase/acylaminoacyl peptidase